jgi:alpha-glucuronidase
MRVDGNATPVKDLVAGRVFHRPIGGLVGVSNVGMDANWLGSPLAMANLYGFGRLAWDPNLTAEKIVEEWTRLTFGSDPLVINTIAAMQLSSWPVYESYTGPLGAGTLTHILGNHYDPGPDSSEKNGWGQWHRADRAGIGMDRTVATGTGFIGQYPSQLQTLYESLAKCPDNLLLFFHHVPYAYVLHSGKTVVQHIYDSHYEGADRARDFISQWQTLEGHVDKVRYGDILGRLQYQAGQAVVWRDTICEWIYRLSGIRDSQHRATPNSPGRH